MKRNILRERVVGDDRDVLNYGIGKVLGISPEVSISYSVSNDSFVLASKLHKVNSIISIRYFSVSMNLYDSKVHTNAVNWTCCLIVDELNAVDKRNGTDNESSNLCPVSEEEKR